MKTIILFLLTLFFANPCTAQTAKDDLNKYWNYRHRFLGKDGRGGFISVGPVRGQSIPASGRNIDCDCLTDWFLVQSKAERHKGNGKMNWGDATVYLGYYTAMLAMEYRNLKDANADTKANERELFYALKAYERLDSLAEVRLGFEGEVNGFFLRDDVPVDFYLGENGKQSRRFRHSENGGYDCIGSDFSKGTHGIDNGSYVSQDQAIALLFGFAFVEKFAGEAKYEKATNERFGDLAQRYSHLIVSYLRKNNWKLKSPDGQKIPNRWGGDARAFNVLFADAAMTITKGKYNYAYNKKTFLGKLLKGSYRWAYGLHNERNYGMILQLHMISNQWSAEQMAKRTKKSDKIFYALADAVLNERALHESIEKTDFESVIKAAPWSGPCFGTKDCAAPDGWKSSDLWWHTNHKNGDPYGRKYEYPGIDYMLLYNLYHYYYKAEMPRYKKTKKIKNRKRKGVEAKPVFESIEKG